eukprot:gnl/Trimastix_PCT/473.p1 GENE.gnl/Trimastix_PCT/473~~gnl/Trimastix_PCT/473.p1  ORF type:complete len:183 (+),score=9.32 gnl/Trimastix_PCT/473:78-626(+)
MENEPFSPDLNENEKEAEMPASTPEAEMDDIEQMKKQVQAMEEENAKLQQLQTHLDSDNPQAEADSRSVYVGNVDYGSTPEDLQAHFQSCGVMKRVTILVNKYTGYPKGCAYIEFMDKEGAKNALALTDSTFRNREIKVLPKRTNLPGYGRFRGSTAPYFPRGRFYRPRRFRRPYMGGYYGY